MKFNLRKIFIISILAICVIAINLVVFFKLTEKADNKKENHEIIIDTITITENFNRIFDNTIDYQKNTINKVKKNPDKELVYTSYINQENLENKYNLNVNIPCLNIDNSIVQKINEEINNLFYNKATEVLAKTNQYTIYDVKYKAYINDNILSLIINCNLKEGDTPQRLIVKTYNYNLASNEELNILNVLSYRSLTKQYVQNRVNNTIKIARDNANKFSQLGYTKYLRDTNDEMYKIENTTNYFIGANKALYIIYAYGNLNYTSELDLVVI